MKICWVDDKLDEAHTFAAALAGLDPEIIFATDGERGLEVLRAAPHDLVIVDLQMPPGQWGGLWLLERLPGIAHPPPALVLSGEGSQQETIYALRLGAMDYVEKTRASEELLERVVATIHLAYDHLLDADESERVEFKESLRFDVAEARVNKHIEVAILKTIAAFANSGGGTLVIGRADDGAVPGIARDLATLREPTVDKFELHVRNLINGALGVDANQLVHLRFPQVRGATMSVVDVDASAKPIFLSTKESEAFYVRAGNSTRSLGVRQAHAYIGDRF